ncbi:MAG: hypothetical protein KDK04_02925 [Candidatus Competibacteraceae bacterium]|nr:hypothetical protein [Candidatus Competibacteraceae bacterium]
MSPERVAFMLWAFQQHPHLVPIERLDEQVARFRAQYPRLPDEQVSAGVGLYIDKAVKQYRHRHQWRNNVIERIVVSMGKDLTGSTAQKRGAFTKRIDLEDEQSRQIG